MYLTKEQEKALKSSKNVAVYEKSEVIIDEVSGQILRNTSQTLTKTENEPDFIKLYYSTMLAFNGVSDVPLDLIIAISTLITWANDGEQMVFRNDKFTKETISQKLNIKESMVTKYIKRCCESGLLVPMENYRGVYYVNPFFIAKGKWEHIKKLRTSFDYINGEWQLNVESQNDDSHLKEVI